MQKTESARSMVVLLLSFSAQFIVCTLIWKFCYGNDINVHSRQMNVQLILPVDEVDEFTIQKKSIEPEEVQLEMIQKLHETEQIIPENPFETPLKMEKPVIIEKKKPEVKEKPVARKPEEKKVIDKPVEPLKDIVAEVKTVVPVGQPSEMPVEEKRQTVSAPKPVLTKAQMNENSKYLAKVMKILEKGKKYSEEARRRNLEGKIIVSFSITREGKTERVKAKTLVPKELADSTEKLIRDAKLPTPPASWPIGSLVEIPISYKIK